MPESLTIASFNVNGIRARLPLLLQWLDGSDLDVLCLQETKVQDADFPGEPFEKLGFQCMYRGQKSFNGVAVLSRKPAELITAGFDDGGPDDASRLMLVDVLGVRVLNTYVPQGSAPDSDRFQYKLEWFDRVRKFTERFIGPDDKAAWVGDFNVALEPKDVYDPEKLLGSVCFHPEEHKALSAVKQWGWVDVFRRHAPDEGRYTFWDYRIKNALKRGLGWRIDHIWATEPLADLSSDSWIDVEPRSAERPSDHTPILARFQLPE